MSPLFFLIAAIALAFPVTIFGAEYQYNVSPENSHNIAIDGDLREWDLMDVAHEQLVTSDSPTLPASSDLSGSFRLHIDDAHLYLGVDVTDDILLFGSESYDQGDHDDSVELVIWNEFWPGAKFPRTKYALIRIVPRDNFTVSLEGSPGIYWGAPHLWELLGAEGAAKATSQGYSAEMRVPLYALNLHNLATNSAISFSVKISDDDDGGGRDDLLYWATNRNGQSTGILSMSGPAGVQETVSEGEPPLDGMDTEFTSLSLTITQQQSEFSETFQALLATDLKADRSPLIQSLTHNHNPSSGLSFDTWKSLTLARVYAYKMYDVPSAIITLKAAAQYTNEPAIAAHAYQHLSHNQLISHQYDEAIASHHNVLAIFPKSILSAPVYLGDLYRLTGDCGRAMPYYQETLASEAYANRHAHTEFHAGYCYYINGNFEDASAHFERVQDLSWQDPVAALEAKYFHGIIDLYRGNDQEAINKLEEILVADAPVDRKLHALTHMGLGRLFFNLKEYVKSEDHLNTVINEFGEFESYAEFANALRTEIQDR